MRAAGRPYITVKQIMATENDGATERCVARPIIANAASYRGDEMLRQLLSLRAITCPARAARHAPTQARQTANRRPVL
jgi:hypothetical protein